MTGIPMEKPLISVLVTAYDLEKYIEECIESVLSQECPYPFEILAGDDGSDDRTYELLKSLEERGEGRLKVFRMDREQGVKYNRVERSSANRLFLLSKAEGRFVSFLDGDDIYTDKGRLRKMADILMDADNEDCILAAHNLDLLYDDGRRVPLSRAVKERKISLEEYWTSMFLQSDAVMFRNIYNEHRPEGRLIYSFDDNNIMFWLLLHGKMYYIPERMAAYRQVGGSSWSAIDELKKNASNMIGYSVERELAPDKRKISDIRHYKNLSFLCAAKGSFELRDLDPFYTTASDHGMKEALEAYSLDGEWIKESLRTGRIGNISVRIRRSIKKMLGLF